MLAGWDNANAGTKTVIDGQGHQTTGGTVIQNVTGLSPMTSELLYGGTQIGTGLMAVKVAGTLTTTDNVLALGKGPLTSDAAATSRGTADALLPDAEFAGRGVVRSDLTDHLVNADVLKKQISGGHNADNFTSALNSAGGTITSQVEIAPGIYQLEYQLPGATKAYPKTVYDPKIYPDAAMADMANTAANKALIQYQLTGITSQKVVVNGVEFSVPVRIQNGQPYVPTAYPIGVKK